MLTNFGRLNTRLDKAYGTFIRREAISIVLFVKKNYEKNVDLLTEDES